MTKFLDMLNEEYAILNEEMDGMSEEKENYKKVFMAVTKHFKVDPEKLDELDKDTRKKVLDMVNNCWDEKDNKVPDRCPINIKLEDSFKLEGKPLNEGRQEAKELELYIENDRDIYKNDIVPFLKFLRRKLKNTKMWKNKDTVAALRVFKQIAEKAARKYEKEHGTAGDTIFDASDIQKAAESVLDFYLEEWKVNQLAGY